MLRTPDPNSTSWRIVHLAKHPLPMYFTEFGMVTDCNSAHPKKAPAASVPSCMPSQFSGITTFPAPSGAIEQFDDTREACDANSAPTINRCTCIALIVFQDPEDSIEARFRKDFVSSLGVAQSVGHSVLQISRQRWDLRASAPVAPVPQPLRTREQRTEIQDRRFDGENGVSGAVRCGQED